jgi:hypothetical protein
VVGLKGKINMSIRVHKMLGYGLEVQTNDPRINSDVDWDLLPDFGKFLQQNREQIISNWLLPEAMKMWPDMDMLFATSNFDFELQRALYQYKNESTVPYGCVVQHRNMLLFRPVSKPDWFRYDNTLDWMEETKLHGQNNRTLVFKTGICPYDHWMVRFRDPPANLFKEPVKADRGHVQVDEKGPVGISTCSWNRRVGLSDPHPMEFSPLEKDEAIRQHYLNDFRPELPAGVIALVLWSGLAVNPVSFLNDLRPMLYVWWD